LVVDASVQADALTNVDGSADALQWTTLDAGASVDLGQIAASDSGVENRIDAVVRGEQDSGSGILSPPEAKSGDGGCSCHLASHKRDRSRGWLVALLAFGLVYGCGRFRRQRP
jgi:hypothetical protein